MRPRRIGIPVAALAIAVSAASCASPTARGPERPPATPATASADGRMVGQETPRTEVPDVLRFTAPALGGGTIRGADFAGEDLVMWFWAPW